MLTSCLSDTPEVVDQQFCMVGTCQMFKALQVRFPVASVLIVQAANDMFAQDQVRLIHIRLIAEQSRRDQFDAGTRPDSAKERSHGTETSFRKACR